MLSIKKEASDPKVQIHFWVRCFKGITLPFVLLDETGTTIMTARRYGWAPKGKRVVDVAPYVLCAQAS